MADETAIYINEWGKGLRKITSPVRRRINYLQKQKSKNAFYSLHMKSYWENFCGSTNETTDDSHQPKTLLDMCYDFVSENIEGAESLEGFPEVIGKELFIRVIRWRLKWQIVPGLEVFKLFVNAYKEEVMSGVYLKDSLCTINNYSEIILLFLPWLKELDLSDCRLGDEHEISQCVNKMKCLVKLNLSRNCLSDTTIRRLTVNYPDVPINLKYLNVAYNKKLTMRSLGCLSCLKELQVLDISGVNLDTVDKLAEKLNMEKSEQVIKETIETKGWSAPLLEGLDTAMKLCLKSKQCQINNKYGGFYKKLPKICLNLFSDDDGIVSSCVCLVKKSTESKSKSRKRLHFTNERSANTTQKQRKM